jgi:acetyl esterase/lipase
MRLNRLWRYVLLSAALACGAAELAAQPPIPVAASAPPETGALPLYPDQAAGPAKEQWVRFGADLAVRNVTRPTLTPFLPEPGKATGAAVIVAPGGAFMLLSMEGEGWAVARALADRGTAAFVLKYRLNETPVDEKAFADYAGARMGEILRLVPEGRMPDIKEPRATEDALAALRMVRKNAQRWGVDPARVGMIGFSAGAMTALNAGLAPNAADRPAFIAPIYPPMLPVSVPADAPPMFAAIAMDDELFGKQGLGLIESWRRANRPVEFHAYERGGHGFGLGRPGTTTTLLLEEFITWLKARGVVPAQKIEGSK